MLFPDTVNLAKFDPFCNMTDSFISLVVKDLLKSYTDLKEIAVIFPNRRAGAMFRKELADSVVAPAWSPGIYSIDDWLVSMSGLQQVDRLTGLALLYRVVQSHLPFIQSFGDFIDLGETILADFDDVDKYLADPGSLFSTLLESKRIDSQFDISADEELAARLAVFWGSFGASRSVQQDSWLGLWEKLLPVYKEFEQVLSSKGMGTSGMCYRKAAADLRSGKAVTGRYKTVVFAGFNILTAAEEDIFTFLKQDRKALFYWDFHPDYLETPHEAGKFLRQYLLKFPAPESFVPYDPAGTGFFGGGGNQTPVTVYPVTSNTGQVQALLDELKSRPECNRGIILSDDSLFSDLLSSWPDDLPVNFTSGYPLRDTRAAGLLRCLTSISADFSRGDGSASASTGLVLDFLAHPWSEWLTGGSARLADIIKRRFPEAVPAGFIEGENSLEPWLAPVPAQDFLVRLCRNCEKLLEYRKDYYPIEQAAIETISGQASAYLDLARRQELVLDNKSVSKLFQRFLGSTNISLETERLANNQVTGVLETRLVDYDEVYILSFNEGIWPSKQLAGSLIPYSLRKLSGLPTAESRDAMYAYYFYRLIQRAASVNIYYLTGHRDDSIRSGERSRYLAQLEFGLGRKLKVIPEPPAGIAGPPVDLKIDKNGPVLEILKGYLDGAPGKRALSPSAINEYIECSLRFALNRVMGLREPEVGQTAADPRGFGTLLHRVMNRLYGEFTASETGPDAAWLKTTLEDREALEQTILEEYKGFLKETGSLKPGGKELLGLEVVRQFVTGILEFDKSNLPFRILSLEREFNMVLPVLTAEGPSAVRLHGYIDRIDMTPGGVRIIDYKTGPALLAVSSIDELFDRSRNQRPKEILQVLLYVELYNETNSVSVPRIPCLFRLGHFRSGDLDHRVQVAGFSYDHGQFGGEFRSGLSRVLEELYNPSVPFTMCEDVQRCRYCPYAGICSRES